MAASSESALDDVLLEKALGVPSRRRWGWRHRDRRSATRLRGAKLRHLSSPPSEWAANVTPHAC